MVTACTLWAKSLVTKRQFGNDLRVEPTRRSILPCVFGSWLYKGGSRDPGSGSDHEFFDPFLSLHTRRYCYRTNI